MLTIIVARTLLKALIPVNQHDLSLLNTRFWFFRGLAHTEQLEKMPFHNMS